MTKTRLGIIAVIALVVIGVIILSVIAAVRPYALRDPDPVSAPAGGPPAIPQPEIPLGTAQYEVSGDGPVTVQYIIEGDEATDHNVALPWKKSSAAPWMSLTARRGEGPGYLTCRITGWGRVMATETVNGPYATCLVTAYQDKNDDDTDAPVEEEPPQ